MSLAIRLVAHLGRGYSVLLALLCWEALARSGLVNKMIFPSLAAIAGQLLDLMLSGTLWPHLGSTLLRAGVGLSLAVIAGIPIGYLMGRSALFHSLFDPLFSVTYPVPRISLYPIFIFIFGLGHLSKISLIALECVYPMVLNAYYGTRQINPRLIWAAQNMGARPWQVLLRVMLPAAAPQLFAGLRIALPVSLVLAVLTEMIGAWDGIGYLIAYASASLDADRMFAGLVVTGVIGFVLDRLLVYITRRLVFWQDISVA